MGALKMRKMLNSFFYSRVKTVSLTISLLSSLIILVSFQNCGKVSFRTVTPEALNAAQGCGDISITPINGLFPSTNITFTAHPPADTSTTGFQWTIAKNQSLLFTRSDITFDHTFDGPNEGVGDYIAVASFAKSDGNICELTRAFRILESDLCVPPSGINGPSIGYVGEETSPFSVDYEACFLGTIVWDMENDNTPDYTSNIDESVTHIYNQPGAYTVKTTIINLDDNTQSVLTHIIEIKNKACAHPFLPGASVAHGQTIEFAKPSAQCGVQCERQVRTCQNGTFDGDATFAQDPATCSATNCSSCKIQYPGDSASYTLAIGASVTRYAKTQSCGGACESNSFTCTQAIANVGSTYSFPAGFTYTNANTCQTENQCANRDCNLDSVTVRHGESYSFFNSETVACGQSCSSQSRTCNDGTLSGNSNYNKATCTVNSCTYTWSIGNWSSCSATACGTNGTRTRPVICKSNNGDTVSDSLCSSPKPTTSESCSARSCNSCTLDGVTVNHNQSRAFYNSSSVACGQTCSSQSRTCNDGTLGGNSNYNKASCSANSCTYAWSTSEWSNCSATVCGTSGERTRTVTCRRSDGTTVSDSNCSGTKPAASTSCSARACNSCTLPWGGSISSGQNVTAYQASQVSCGQSCKSQTRTCTDGTLSGSYDKKSCAVAACPVNGACGSSHGKTLTSKPTANLCSKGSASSVSTTSSSYTWTCSGQNGGSNASCSATRKHFEVASCGFGLISSNWQGSAGQPTSSYGSCEWAGSMTMGSSNSVYAVFHIADYYDNSGPYGIFRLNNPNDWTITASGCSLGTIVDPKNIYSHMPNYCKAGTRSYGGTPLVWNATITATHKSTGEVKTIPITATFKPTLNGGGGGGGGNPPPGGGGGGGGTPSPGDPGIPQDPR